MRNIRDYKESVAEIVIGKALILLKGTPIAQLKEIHHVGIESYDALKKQMFRCKVETLDGRELTITYSEPFKAGDKS